MSEEKTVPSGAGKSNALAQALSDYLDQHGERGQEVIVVTIDEAHSVDWRAVAALVEDMARQGRSAGIQHAEEC